MNNESALSDGLVVVWNVFFRFKDLVCKEEIIWLDDFIIILTSFLIKKDAVDMAVLSYYD